MSQYSISFWGCWKFIIALLLSGLFHFSVAAQPVYSIEQLPGLGDTLTIGRDRLPERIDLGAAGSQERFDFSSLNAPFAQRSVWETARGDHPFFTADLKIQVAPGLWRYYRKDRDRIYWMGVEGQDPLGLGIKGSFALTQPLEEWRAPLRYGEDFLQQSGWNWTFSYQQAPPGLKKQLPYRPDSIRIRIDLERLDVVDGWGRLFMPGGIFEVLREKRYETRLVEVDTKVGNRSWQTTTNLLPNLEWAGRKELEYHYYWAEGQSHPVVVSISDGATGTVEEVRFLGLSPDLSIRAAKSLQAGVFASPNPAITYTRFEFSGLEPGHYTLSILNIIGREIWAREYQVAGDFIDKVELAGFNKGAYLYSLRDASGNTLITRRLNIIRP